MEIWRILWLCRVCRQGYPTRACYGLWKLSLGSSAYSRPCLQGSLGSEHEPPAFSTPSPPAPGGSCGLRATCIHSLHADDLICNLQATPTPLWGHWWASSVEEGDMLNLIISHQHASPNCPLLLRNMCLTQGAQGPHSGLCPACPPNVTATASPHAGQGFQAPF